MTSRAFASIRARPVDAAAARGVGVGSACGIAARHVGICSLRTLLRGLCCFGQVVEVISLPIAGFLELAGLRRDAVIEGQCFRERRFEPVVDAKATVCDFT